MTSIRNPHLNLLTAFATACLVVALASSATAQSVATRCNRACISGIVDDLLASMVRHDPDGLPLAQLYAATENSHPSALGSMTLWRTVTEAGQPALLIIDERQGAAYFALPVSEGTSVSALWGRIKVVNRSITELELFVNRSRGDHGFTFGAEQMRANYARLMSPPATRRRASRAVLEQLSAAAFDGSHPMQIEIDPNCQFTEVGGLVIDPGLDDVAQPPGRDPEAPLGCMMPPQRPNDPQARVIAIDEELGLVVVAAVVPGRVYPYPFHGDLISAFIPTQMQVPMDAQDAWLARKVEQGVTGLLAPADATGEVMQVLQYYDRRLQAEQINVYLSGPGMRSAWVRE